MMETVDVPAAPGRLIHAVANIGYDTEVALCDLIDNSIDAGAKNISLILVPENREDEGETDTISKYVIADDGCGMDSKTLITAFTLGTAKKYKPHSLGKFGLGLKSAGLGLGHQLVVLSKNAEMKAPLCARLNLQEIENSGKYQISLGEADVVHTALWEKYRASEEHGTVLIIEELNDNQPSYSQFSDYIKRYCSLVYHMFMEDAKPVAMSVNGSALKPTDPLFYAESKQNGPMENPQFWDGKTCHVLLEDAPLDLEGVAKGLISATNLVHPPSFEADGTQQEVREHYMIAQDPYTKRPRHGFYVYRNRRIIVAAERFNGLIASAVEAWAFRARLMFDEGADALLSLDVKKRHCQLPRKARNNLKSMISAYQTKSIEAWKIVGRIEAERKRTTKEDVANESIANAPVTDLTYSPGAAPEEQTPVATAKRKERQEDIRNDTAQAIQDAQITPETLDKRAAQKSAVTMVTGLKANAMWLVYPSVEAGKASTLVNKAHSWIAEAYAFSEKQPGIAIVLHHLFTILARAELEVRSTQWNDTSLEVAGKVLERFRKKASAIGEDLADALALALESGKFDDTGE